VHNSEIIRLIQIALNEDIRTGDVTAESIFPEIGAWSHGTFIAKQHGIACGLSVAGMVFQIVSDNRITWVKHVQDGDIVEPGMILAEIDGEARDLLSGERTALNFMQRMSVQQKQQNMFMLYKEREPKFSIPAKRYQDGENWINMR